MFCLGQLGKVWVSCSVLFLKVMIIIIMSVTALVVIAYSVLDGTVMLHNTPETSVAHDKIVSLVDEYFLGLVGQTRLVLARQVHFRLAEQLC